ncbi:hypothetical protein LCGC14_0777830 [marine sediment metagenome]|uniref:HTH cro/C1-type domain-containing protein n=1 Tax=marine sediment metagenome TaxID=412755 RepID=A0A0F9SG82_9ZZZZ
MKSLSDKVLSLRKSMGYSQEKFGEKFGVSQQVISGIETGKKKPSKTFSIFIDYIYSATFTGKEADKQIPTIGPTGWKKEMNEILLDLEGLSSEQKEMIKVSLKGMIAVIKPKKSLVEDQGKLLIEPKKKIT